MINSNLEAGLSYEQIKEFIDDELDKNADILIGIDDPEMQEMVNILVEVFCKAIEKNNEQISEDLKQYLKK